jgi:hypothetical protein
MRYEMSMYFTVDALRATASGPIEKAQSGVDLALIYLKSGHSVNLRLCENTSALCAVTPKKIHNIHG